MSIKSANPIDIQVGLQIKLRRKTIGVSQSLLADKLGITFQQVQKYEKGVNRVGASRLQAIAGVLGVSVEHFFNSVDSSDTALKSRPSDEAQALQSFMASSDGFALNRAFFKIKDETVRRRVVALVKALADGAEVTDPSLRD
ncbi:helix-turn-helix transcriptional regulator [Rhizobium sp. 18065]|uniref:helix-turn-helix domain-containing protein n=1 Tax=Rhizobium sp. 18065 TaxID=2681411 RepID=UPI00135BF9C0|nr:helix-turn-helix transcriptional regulator [Rhizobium sp. 18065]